MKSITGVTPIEVLLVEDNEGDIILVKEAFKDLEISISLTVIRDGGAALFYLEQQLASTTGGLPDMIILDINLPVRSGQEVLKKIKAHSELYHIPVVMLTTSSAPEDVKQAYENYVNCFITKPIDIDDFLKVITSIENFWISTVKFPPK